jgi:hypothetical protein
MLTPAQQDLLEQYYYLRDYYLTNTGFCYRTHVAMRAMVTSSKKMEGFLTDEYDGQEEEEKFDTKCREICRVLRNEFKKGMQSIEGAEVESHDHATQTLNMRWTQLPTMLDQAEAQMFK